MRTEATRSGKIQEVILSGSYFNNCSGGLWRLSWSPGLELIPLQSIESEVFNKYIPPRNRNSICTSHFFNRKTLRPKCKDKELYSPEWKRACIVQQKYSRLNPCAVDARLRLYFWITKIIEHKGLNRRPTMLPFISRETIRCCSYGYVSRFVYLDRAGIHHL